MVQISDLLIAHPEISSFSELNDLVVEAAQAGEIHLYFDIKPEFPDTPRKWETELELAFYRGGRTAR
ncbi:MAG: sulfur relay protein DsrC [Xanthobacteraceae bacterium]